MISKLHIQTSFTDGITQLSNCFFSPPFKVMNITEDKQGKLLQLMLMSSSPGILDEDKYELKIEVAENASLQLQTQSYQRLFNMQLGATQFMEVYLQNGASFTYLPHPAVPHKNSIFTARNKIYLNNQCTLIWGEILTCGRKLNDEVFEFLKYHNITEVYLNEKLILKENLLVQPQLVNPNKLGQLEGYTHQASFIYLNETINPAELCDTVYEFLSNKKEIQFGVSTIQSNGIVVRILGFKAEQLFNSLKEIAALLQHQNAVNNA
jgi:urease accessory protein